MTRKETGVLCYITSNKWMRAWYGEKLREYFSKHNPLKLLDLGSNVFSSATVDSNILLIQNTLNTGNTLAITVQDNSEDLNIQMKEANIMNLNISSNWFIGSGIEIALKDKIEKLGKPLKEWGININYGIKTGLNEAFIISRATRDKLISEDYKNNEIIKPILRGKDIWRYVYKFANLYLLQTGYDLDVPTLYPSIYSYLKDIWDKIENWTLKVKWSGLYKRDDQGKNWWNLRACVYYNEFDKEKVIWQEMAQEPTFSYDNQGVFSNDTWRILTGENIKFFVGFFNSDFFKFAFSNYYAGGWLWEKWVRYKGDFMNAFPVPPITEDNQSIVLQIESIVEMIIKNKETEINTDTSSLEKEINILVYQLYKLTPEEIAIIEGGK